MRTAICGVLGILAACGVVGAQQGRFLDVVVTTDDGDSIVEPGEVARIALLVDLEPSPGEGLFGFAGARFDTIGGLNADTGSISSFNCLNALCVGGDTTTSDGVSLFGTNVMQVVGQAGFSFDDPIGVYAFTWKTDDFTPRTVRYSTKSGLMQAWIDEQTIVSVPVVEADIEFCVGSCIGDVVPDLPFGLEHEVLGDASFDIDDRGRMRLRGIGEAGEDGFRVAIGDAERHRVKIDPSNIGAGGALELSSLAPGTDGGIELLTTRIEGGPSWSWFMHSEADSVHTYEFTAFSESDLLNVRTCTLCSFETTPFMRTPADVICAVTVLRQVDSSRIVNIELEQPSMISMYDGDEFVADRIQVRLVDFEPPAASHTRVLATKISSLSITEEQFGLFDLMFRSLDGARADASGACPGCRLFLSNIGASGDDGIEYDFQPARIFRTRMTYDQVNIDQSRIVSVWFESPSTLDAETVSLQLEGHPSGFVALTPWLEEIGTDNSIVTAGLRSDGELVQAVSGTADDPPVLLADGVEDPWVEVQFVPKVKLDILCEDDFQVFDENGNLLGIVDEIEYSIAPEAVDITAILGAAVTGTNESYEILEVDVVDLCSADCDGDGSLTILDFICYQNLFTMNDVAADCDGNGVLNILDFVCFQNAFVAGCV